VELIYDRTAGAGGESDYPASFFFAWPLTSSDAFKLSMLLPTSRPGTGSLLARLLLYSLLVVGLFCCLNETPEQISNLTSIRLTLINDLINQVQNHPVPPVSCLAKAQHFLGRMKAGFERSWAGTPDNQGMTVAQPLAFSKRERQGQRRFFITESWVYNVNHGQWKR